MNWTALVPVKAEAERKTRLADSLSREERARLSEALLRHVLGALQQSAGVSTIAILSRQRPAHWAGVWIDDGGRGLNAEIDVAARALGGTKLLVVHADLPLVSAEDIDALLIAAAGGIAVAPDRHDTGTNALALSDVSGFRFGFGADSFRHHCEDAKGRARVVRRPGLALDIDTADDLAAARAAGFRDR